MESRRRLKERAKRDGGSQCPLQGLVSNDLRSPTRPRLKVSLTSL